MSENIHESVSQHYMGAPEGVGEKRLPYWAARLELPAAYRLDPESDQYNTPSEDVTIFDKNHGLFGVLDGMGGEGDNPRLAAETVANSLQGYLTSPEVLEQLNSPDLTAETALYHMREAFRQARHAAARYAPGSGTTAAVLQIVTIGGQRHALIGNAGDSRIFKSPPPEQGDELRLAKDRPRRPDFRYQLTDDQGHGSTLENWVGSLGGTPVVEDNIRLVPVNETSRFLIVSDGISGDNDRQYLTSSELLMVFVQPTPQEAAQRLADISRKIDDKSVIVIDVDAANPGNPGGSHERTKSIAESRAETYEELDRLRDIYLSLEAGRSRRAIHANRKYSKRSVEAAKRAYEEHRNEVLNFELVALSQQGASLDEIEQAVEVALFNEERTLAKRMLDHRLVATGNYRFADDGSIEAIQKTGVGAQLNKFYEWFGTVNESGTWRSKGAMKKGAVLVGAGAVIGAAGAVLAPIAGVTAAGAGGAALASRVTKTYMSTHIRKKSEDFNEQRAISRRDELLQKFGDGTAEIGMLDLLTDQSNREVEQNRRRTAMIVGAAVLGGMLSTGLVHALQGVGPDHVTTGRPEQPSQGPSHGPSGGGHPPPPGNGGGQPPHEPEHPEQKGKTAGFTERVSVEAGHGWTYEIQDSFAEKGVHLTSEQTLAIYDHLNRTLPGLHGNFFTDGSVYTLPDGRTGINSPGIHHWNPRALEEMQRYAEEHELLKKKAA